MKKIYNTFLVFLSAILLISCQKELTMDSSLGLAGTGTTAGLKGNWKFIGMFSKTESIVELNDGVDVLKTVSLSEFNSLQNTGTVKIDGSKMTSTGFGYQVDTLATGLIYENNILID